MTSEQASAKWPLETDATENSVTTFLHSFAFLRKTQYPEKLTNEHKILISTAELAAMVGFTLEFSKQLWQGGKEKEAKSLYPNTGSTFPSNVLGWRKKWNRMKVNKIIPKLLVRHITVRSFPHSLKHKKHIEDNASFFLMLLERQGEGADRTRSSSFPSSTLDPAVYLLLG